jgi:diguanylate cyclase
MDSRGLIEEVQQYLRLALPIMSKQQIPITPKNYSVWYRYVSGADEELRTTIDAMLQRGGGFSAEENEALYRRFCSEEDGAGLRKIREELQELLRTILKEVTELTGETKDYESFISQSVDRLSEGASIEEIKRVFTEIIDKTKTLGGYGKAIQHKLKETTEALEELKKDFEELKTEASVDFLTGTPNRKAFDTRLADSIKEASTGDKDLSLLLIDIDNFKRFNDRFGHLVGDDVLRFVAKKIKETVKGRDFLARFGGEEFAVILPRTPLAGAASVAEGIRSLFEAMPLKTSATAKDIGVITVSIGVARFRAGESSEEFIRRTDKALYAAKNAGRNHVVTVSDKKA